MTHGRMLHKATGLLWGAAAVSLCLVGCTTVSQSDDTGWEAASSGFAAALLDVEYPDVEQAGVEDHQYTAPPLSLAAGETPETEDLTLEQAVQLALANSQVLRDLGGVVLQSPQAAPTVFDPAILELDPQFGVDAALSAFDASFAANAFFENNDRAINNSFFGGGTRILKQDLAVFGFELAKKTATGGDLFLRKDIDYDANNAPGNVFPSAWNAILEAEFRQPLFQGAGVEYNRIAGPAGVPGISNGVLIARINTDTSLADFELGVRNLISDVEDLYWELYFAYRDLDAKIGCRDQALRTWQIIKTWNEVGRTGGEAEFEAQAREQYYRFQADVQNALAGSPIEKTRTAAFRGTGGVYTTERRLRLLIGKPINDARLLKPVDEPVPAKVVFDWNEILGEAMMRRPELRRQRWQIKRRELELNAARNHLLPRVDAIGRYRWRGFGNDLINSNRVAGNPFDNAYQNLTTGDFQEWQLGVEMTMPVGFRQAHAAVQNAKLKLAREKALLDAQEESIAHDLSTAVAEMGRAFELAKTNYNRRQAALDQLGALQAKEPEPSQLPIHIKLVLDGQRRLCDAETQYYLSLAEYARAIKEVQFHKGSLLDYNQVHLTENGWPSKAYHDAAELASRRRPPAMRRSLLRHQPPVISNGPYPLPPGPTEVLMEETPVERPELEAAPTREFGLPRPQNR